MNSPDPPAEDPSPHTSEEFLRAMGSDDRQNAEPLFEMVYAELRQLASKQIQKENAGITLQATALVNEVWLKLIGQKDNAPDWNNKEHVLIAAANAMRRILVDAARARKRQKRGGEGFKRVELQNDLEQQSEDDEMIALSEALDELCKRDAVKAELVKLRYFAGLTNAAASKQLGISTASGERYWAFARSWLRTRMMDQSD